MDAVKQVPAKIRQLYKIVGELEELFEGRRFTPDGHLVGSIGEVLAAHYYELYLLPASADTHDARTKNGVLVQIKATQRTSVGIRAEPEHLVVLRIQPDGGSVEVFNGPGRLAWKNAGKMQKNGQRTISCSKLLRLMGKVPETDRIPRIS